MKKSQIYSEIKAMTYIPFSRKTSLCLLAAIATTIAGFSQEGATSSATVGTEPDTKPTTHRPSHLYGEWFCNGDKADVYRIQADKTAQHFHDKGAWRVTNGLLTISWENGYRLTIDTRQTGSSFIGNSFPPGRDQPDRLKFTKVGHEPTDPPPSIPIK